MYNTEYPLNDFKVLGGRVTKRGNNYEHSGTMVFRMVAPADLKTCDFSRLIARELSYSYCAHDYDCCGCAYYLVDVKRVSKREYSVHRVTYVNI